MNSIFFSFEEICLLNESISSINSKEEAVMKFKKMAQYSINSEFKDLTDTISIKLDSMDESRFNKLVDALPLNEHSRYSV